MSRQKIEPALPRETSARMGDLATLPVFLKLQGKIVLVVGGSAGTAWKAELLAAAGALVRLVWNDPDQETLKLVREWPERIILHQRGLAEVDFQDIVMAIGALEDEREAADFAARARAQGIPVNVVDKPAWCDFQFGAIVNRSPLVIGISTDGGAPTLGQAVRSMVETLLPQGLSLWAKAAKTWRMRVANAGLDSADRKTFWRRFAKEAMARPNQAPCPVEREMMIAEIERKSISSSRGQLALVGAGPGDPELLTLKAIRFLREADVILYDDLVSEGVIAFARREARKIHVGKRGGQSSCSQIDITSLAVLLAQEGNRVVRLKGGDPLVFGRADEEIAAARKAGVTIEIVNGISAAQGAASALSMSLTKRGVARRLQFVTAHGENGDIPDTIDWQAMAGKEMTTCVYMGRRVIGSFLDKVMAAGLHPDTPAHFVINATLPRQEILSADICTIAAMVARSNTKGAGVLIFGDALEMDAIACPAPWALAAE